MIKILFIQTILDKIWKTLKKSSETGQDSKTLISAFKLIFDCYCKSFTSAWETGH